MDQNYNADYLNRLFADITLSGITESNKDCIEDFFIEILDSTNNEFYNNVILYQMLLLIDQDQNKPYFLALLVEEIKLKSLRLTYQKMLKPEHKCSCNDKNKNNNENNAELPTFQESEKLKLPRSGSTGIVRAPGVYENKEAMITYEVDSTGKALAITDIEYKDNRINKIENLNNSPVANCMKKYEKLNENDL